MAYFQNDGPRAGPQTHQAPPASTHPWVLCFHPVSCSQLCLRTSQSPFNIQPKYCHRGEDSEVSAPPKAPHPHSLVQSVLYGLGPRLLKVSLPTGLEPVWGLVQLVHYSGAS